MTPIPELTEGPAALDSDDLLVMLEMREQGALTTWQVGLSLYGTGPLRGRIAPLRRRRLIALEQRGLVCKTDTLSPTFWRLTDAGWAELEQHRVPE